MPKLATFDKNKTHKGDHNRKCPKCGSSCVGVILTDVTAGYGEGGFYWEDMAVQCSQCDWLVQTRSSNS